MNRPLLIFTIAITAVLLWTLKNRSVEIDHSLAVTPLSSDVIEGTRKLDDTQPTVVSSPTIEPRWQVAQLKRAEEDLGRWQLSGGILDEIPPQEDLSPREERLRFHQLLRGTLLELATSSVEENPQLQIHLRHGPSLNGEIVPSDGDGLVVHSSSGATLQIPSSSIIGIGSPDPESESVEEMAELLGPGTLTRKLLDLLPENTVEASVLWPRWLVSGGPAFLARWQGGERKQEILAAIDRQRSLEIPAGSGIDPAAAVSRNPRELEKWMAEINERVRKGIPGAERSALLASHQEWQKWLDLRGPDVYRSEATLSEARQKLQILLSDIVRSSGF